MNLLLFEIKFNFYKMSENFKENQIISDKLKTEDSLMNNNKNEDLISRLKEVHCKNEVRTFDLNEKFNQIKEELQLLMEEFKSNNENSDDLENDEIDFISIKEYIKEYISNERNTSINIINNTFEKINNHLEEIVENKNSNLIEIENILNELKNEFEQNRNDIINHNLEISTQKEEIKNKLDVQLQEQFDKIDKLIKEEEQNFSLTQIDNLKRIKELISNILKYIKKEKNQ